MSNSKHILYGPSDDVENKSLGEVILNSLRQNSSTDIALVDAHTGKSLSYGDILERSVQVAINFQKNGIRKDDIIALVCQNSLDFIVPVLAALYLGAIIHPGNPDWTGRELKYAFDMSKPKWVICSETAVDAINKLKAETKYIEQVIVFGPKQNGVKCFDDFLQSTNQDIKKFEPEVLNPVEQVAFILGSSGTTGLPKCVMITHRNMVLTNHHWRDTNFGNYQKGDCTIAPMPLFHIFGLNLILVSLVASVKYVLIDKFTPDLYLKSIERYQANKLSCPPHLIVLLAKSSLIPTYNISTLKEIVYGTGPLKLEIEKLLLKRLNVVLKQAFGATEMAGPCTMIGKNSMKSGSCGVLLSNFSAKVRDPDTGKVLGPNQTGELCFKGPCIMKGYLNNPEETANSFDEDGFYLTGDIGHYDNDGFFFIVDRLKDLIIYNGSQIAPAELEGILLLHPAVKDAAVIGIPDETVGELPLAYIVKQSNKNITEKELVDFVAGHVFFGKRLHGGVKFVNEIPKTPSGKILRRKLRDMTDNVKALASALLGTKVGIHI